MITKGEKSMEWDRTLSFLRRRTKGVLEFQGLGEYTCFSDERGKSGQGIPEDQEDSL